MKKKTVFLAALICLILAGCPYDGPTRIIPLTGISISPPDTGTMLPLGSTATLKVQAVPAQAALGEVSWTSSDTSYVSVDSNGRITAKKATYQLKGSQIVTDTEGIPIHNPVEITASANGYSASVSVQVTRLDGLAIEFLDGEGPAALPVGGSIMLIAEPVPADAQIGTVRWSNQSSSLADLKGDSQESALATLTAKSTSGTAKITATASGKSASKTISLAQKPNKLTVTPQTPLTVKTGNTASVTATLTPSGAGGLVIWRSSDYNIISLDKTSGSTVKVTGQNKGQATLTAAVNTYDSTNLSPQEISIKVTVQ